MEHTVVARFDTRRSAELAVEHLVQEHGIDRSDIFIRAPGKANTVGTRRAGADLDGGGDPELAGPIEVSVDCHDEREQLVRSVLREAGGRDTRILH